MAAGRPELSRCPMRSLALFVFALVLGAFAVQAADDGPDLIFKKTTVWKFLSPDHKLAAYGLDDPIVEGVA